jgi:hypothetical protein
MPASSRTMKSARIGIGFSHHNVPSLSNTATRSPSGTPAVTVPSTNSTTARRAAPPFQLASIPVTIGPTLYPGWPRQVSSAGEVCR